MTDIAIAPPPQVERPATPRMPIRVVIALTGLAVLVVCAVFVPWLPIADPFAQDLARRLSPPLSDGYLLGSDQLGRDVLSRLIYGARVSLMIALFAVVIAGVVGTTIGMWSGYAGPRVDAFFTWLANVQLAFPMLLLAITLSAIIGGSIYGVIIVLGATAWPTYARVARAQTLSLKTREFVLAAQVMHEPTFRIVGVHILPNLLGSVVAVCTIEAASMIILEAGLSFLGLGVPVGTPSWGTGIAEGVLYLESAWWIAVFPGVMLTLTVMVISVIGEWMSDRLAGHVS